MSYKNVALPVIRRLPRYYRYISELHQNGTQRISSSQLAAIMGSTPSQVRQDFNCFGGFGQQGVGYSVETLYTEIHNLIFPNSKNLKAVLIGAGNLGATITRFIQEDAAGVDLVAVFDSNEEIIGQKLSNLVIYDFENLLDYCEVNTVDLLIICIPREAAKDVASILVQTKVRSMWNFSHFDFALYDDSLIVENVHLRDSLMALSFRTGHQDENNKK